MGGFGWCFQLKTKGTVQYANYLDRDPEQTTDGDTRTLLNVAFAEDEGSDEEYEDRGDFRQNEFDEQGIYYDAD